MAEARERSGWARASALLALIANAHRDPKKTRAFKPGDFDPYAHPGDGVTHDTAALKARLQGKAQGGTPSKEARDGG